MMQHGHRPRFRADSGNVQRTIFSNGTITTIVFRKHVLRMGQRPDRWTPRAETLR